MKKFIILIISAVLIYSQSCDSIKEPIYETNYKFINETGQNVCIVLFPMDGYFPDSIDFKNSDFKELSFSNIGGKLFPFSSLDSSIVKYNDTTYIEFVRGVNAFDSFLNRDNWNEIENTGYRYYYEFIFNEEDYQEALNNDN